MQSHTSSFNSLLVICLAATIIHVLLHGLFYLIFLSLEKTKCIPHQKPGCYSRSVNMTRHVTVIRWAAMIFTCCSMTSVTVVFLILTHQILSIRVLPCSFAMLYNMLDARLFLWLQLVPHKEDTLLYHVLGVNCCFSLIIYFRGHTTW
jgi:hypothetical protein